MAWVDDYFAAWARHAQAADPVNGTADLDRLQGFLDADLVYEDVPSAQVFRGTEGFVTMCGQAGGMAPDMRFECVSKQCDGEQFAFESEMFATVGGAPVKLRMVSIGKRGADGLVIEHRDYWDLTALLRQTGQMPA